MNAMIRRICAAFVVFTVAFTVVGCAGSADEAFEVDYEQSSTEINFEGAIFAFGSNWIFEYKIDEGVSDSGDKMNARYKAIEEKFNVTFNLLDSNYCSASAIMANSASGLYENIPDAMDIAGDQAYSMYKKDMLFPFDGISTIDITDEKYGSENFVLNGASWGGHRWCIYPNNWQLAPQYVGSIIFDNQLLTKYSYGSKPYELMESGEWTWDNFEKLLSDMTFTEGENVYTGLCYETINWLCESAIMSNGGNAVVMSGETPVFGYNSDASYEALEWLAGMYSAGYMYNASGIGKLNDGNTAFQYSQVQEATFIDNEDSRYAFTLSDYGVVPFPWGPKAEYGVTCSSFVYANRRFICCLAVAGNDRDDFGLILDYMLEPLDGDAKEQWKETLRYVLHHEKDVDNFVWLYENLGYNYTLELSDVYSDLQTAFKKVLTGGDTASSAMSALTAAANASIQDYWEN